MTDYFAVLGEPRSASLDVGALKRKYHERAAAEHPDVTRDGDFETVNVAYRTLRDPKLRVAHLIELTGEHASSITQPPADLVEVFFAVGAALQTKDLQRIEAQLARVSDLRARIVESLRRVAVSDTAALRDAHARLAFLDRWHEQLSEAGFAG